MSGLLEVPGLGPATLCVISKAHTPEPLRFVWHHVQPQEAGGLTTLSNLRQVCDSCHYSVHRLLYALRCQNLGIALTPAQEEELASPPRVKQLKMAEVGFAACVAAGTVAQIPNEG